MIQIHSVRSVARAPTRIVSPMTRSFTANSLALDKYRDLLAKTVEDPSFVEKYRKQKRQEKFNSKKPDWYDPTPRGEYFKILDEHFASTNKSPRTLMKEVPSVVSNFGKVLEYLGTSRNQLLDPYIVSKDTKKLLDKGEPVKAMYLARLAKDKGTVGLNLVLQYYMDKRLYQRALDLLNDMKKWSCPPNDHTYTIMLKGLGTFSEFTPRGLEIVVKIYDTLATEQKINIFQRNSALRACLQTPQGFSLALKIYNEMPIKGRNVANRFTFSMIFNTLKPTYGEKKALLGFLRKVWSDAEMAQSRLDEDRKHIKKSKDRTKETGNDIILTPELVADFCRAYVRMDQSKESVDYAFQVVNKYFGISLRDSSGIIIQKGTFDLSRSIVDFILNTCLESKQYQNGIDYFNAFLKSPDVIFKPDTAIYNDYLLCHTKLSKATEALKALKFLDKQTHKNKDLELTTSSVFYCTQAFIGSIEKPAVLFDHLETLRTTIMPQHSLMMTLKVFSGYMEVCHNIRSGLNEDQLKILYTVLQQDIDLCYSKSIKNDRDAKRAFFTLGTILKFIESQEDMKRKLPKTMTKSYIGSIKRERKLLRSKWNFGKERGVTLP
ncbi:hypothetical protein NADFUDRAFT_42359 [Nadsonia fulvescens var. elongata DSM 6958]|uniref:Mitochondrial group I intron splicing factor CCM1 n=1 Tax=Nadsonia fulvescens var. elongata DSM 6958 TaxID=857566 RepID=A0A1E3PID9_9ASCO|nr:hypothetical protein NADFUDRAFT_42359 [Nadsonia fulvescens var. elongata DSM 6958]